MSAVASAMASGVAGAVAEVGLHKQEAERLRLVSRSPWRLVGQLPGNTFTFAAALQATQQQEARLAEMQRQVWQCAVCL